MRASILWTITPLVRPVLQYAFIKVGIIRPEKRKMAILNNVSGVLKPGRTTLLLGPPAAGKSTLLKALAGKLQHGSLKVCSAIISNSRRAPRKGLLSITRPPNHVNRLHGGVCVSDLRGTGQAPH